MRGRTGIGFGFHVSVAMHGERTDVWTAHADLPRWLSKWITLTGPYTLATPRNNGRVIVWSPPYVDVSERAVRSGGMGRTRVKMRGWNLPSFAILFPEYVRKLVPDSSAAFASSS